MKADDRDPIEEVSPVITNLLGLFSPRYRYSGRHRAPEARPRHAAGQDIFDENEHVIWSLDG